MSMGIGEGKPGEHDVHVIVTATNDVSVHGYSIAFTYPSEVLSLSRVSTNGTSVQELEPEFVGSQFDNQLGVASMGVISWSYYGEQCWAHLFGVRSIWVYKAAFLIFAWLGAIFEATAVIDFGDMMILGMAFPNLVGVMLLSGKVRSDLDRYMRRLRAGDFTRYS